MADVNHFEAAGGLGFLIRELANNGAMHRDVRTVFGHGMDDYMIEAGLDAKEGTIIRRPATEKSGDEEVLAPFPQAFEPTGGLTMLSGNIGKAVIKTSAVKKDRRIIEAPARIFNDQDEMQTAFKAGEFTEDCIVVIRYQGPKANGMPELHKLTPILGILQDRGLRVALVTDGRMSGASGKIPAAIHVTPEALDGGMIGKIHNGDRMRLDTETGTLEILVDEETLRMRPQVKIDLSANTHGMGRELFETFRRVAGHADEGASVFG